MKRTFTKYPTNYVKASGISNDYPNARQDNVIFEVCHTDRSGKRVTGQLYTASTVSARLQDLLNWGCTDISVTEYTEK